MLFEAEFWVAVAFVIFMGILAYVGVPTMLARSLDARGTRDQGRTRRSPSPARRGAGAAGRIPAQAARGRARSRDDHPQRQGRRRADAAEAAAKVDEFVARRTKMAETKIGQAEAQAVAEVRAAAADAAVAAAEKILAAVRQGQGRRRADRAGNRGRQGQAELIFAVTPDGVPCLDADNCVQRS